MHVPDFSSAATPISHNCFLSFHSYQACKRPEHLVVLPAISFLFLVDLFSSVENSSSFSLAPLLPGFCSLCTYLAPDILLRNYLACPPHAKASPVLARARHGFAFSRPLLSVLSTANAIISYLTSRSSSSLLMFQRL